MPITVGIPRSLAYYDYFPLWKTFLEGLGTQVVTSPPTNKGIVDFGVLRAVNGTCLPIKISYGHVEALIKRGVDVIFLPRLISVARREFICPKFMGLPDMVAAAFDDLPPLLSPCINLNRPKWEFWRQIFSVGRYLGAGWRQTLLAFHQAWSVQQNYERFLQEGHLPREWNSSLGEGNSGKKEKTSSRLRIGLLGHSYLLYDDYANMKVINRLQAMDVQVITVDMLPPDRLWIQSCRWPKRMYWTSGRRILGAALEFMDIPVDGIIYITAFACGTDSLTAELVERTVRRHSTIPQLILSLDEHTGEAGVVTRLEAFVDMVKWKNRAVN